MSARRSALAVLTVVVALLAGCGGDDGGDDVEVSPEAEAWTSDLCGALRDWQEAIGVLVQQGEPTSRTELVTFFTGSLDATRALLRDLEAAEPPDVEGAVAVAEVYLDGFRQGREITEEALARAEALPEEITEAERDEVLALIQDGFGEISESFARAPEEVDAPEIEAALGENPDCAAVG